MRPVNMIDAPDLPTGPFEGCLSIMNVGLKVAKAFPRQIDRIREWVGSAYAKGQCVVFLHDSALTVEKPIDDVEWIDGMTFIRVAEMYGMNDNLSFDLLPDKKLAQLRMLASGLRQDSKMIIRGGKIGFCGFCHIGGDRVFMPLTEV